jgi:hypothetical protein
MVLRLSKLCIAATAVVGVLFLTPVAALADDCSGGSSSVNIYSECIPTPSGGTHHTHTHKTTTTHTTPPPTYTVTTPAVVVPPVIVVPKKVQKTIAHAKHHKHLLKKIVSDPSLGATASVVAPASYKTTPPSALAAVFDLGSGPTALFAMLAAVAIVLLSIGGLRRRQNRL